MKAKNFVIIYSCVQLMFENIHAFVLRTLNSFSLRRTWKVDFSPAHVLFWKTKQERFLFYVVNVRSHLREKRPLNPSKNNALKKTRRISWILGLRWGGSVGFVNLVVGNCQWSVGSSIMVLFRDVRILFLLIFLSSGFLSFFHRPMFPKKWWETTLFTSKEASKSSPDNSDINRIFVIIVISNWPAPLFFPSHLYRRPILRRWFDSPRAPLFFPWSMASRDTIRILHKFTIYETLAKNNHTSGYFFLRFSHGFSAHMTRPKRKLFRT